ncbi:unnamed protein product [Linum trigynum]|uniref:Uncharacterized protein n=1 Tax=Linum trigynum TaxID=586398 RepID=A0AAV2GGS7_9ROSI
MSCSSSAGLRSDSSWCEFLFLGFAFSYHEQPQISFWVGGYIFLAITRLNESLRAMNEPNISTGLVGSGVQHRLVIDSKQSRGGELIETAIDMAWDVIGFGRVDCLFMEFFFIQLAAAALH